ncbi:uncharacterized protein LOC113276331 [Papaver somniferum]|uniref:uncharacterized protein LOC113276331 n=1 Tax=Papaver somniferum TaxID=3469 RepID=UPI000E6F6A44|nr:uncharacterized protein LOC113276331 [Papaver somniferum]
MISKTHIPEDRDYEHEDSSSDGDVSAITEARLCTMIEKHSDDLMCKMFPQSLAGGAMKWFNKLPEQSIGTYHELAYQYDQIGVYGSLVKRPPKTLEGLYDRVKEYARVEDDSKARETRYVNRSSNHPNDWRKKKSKNGSSGQHNDRGEVRENNQGERMEIGYQKIHDLKLTPLNIQLAELYEKISKDLSPPRPFPAETRDKRDRRKNCKFHKYHGHKTENCRALQIEVQRMIDAGKLQEYVKKDFGKGPGKFGTTHVIKAHVINVSHARIHSMSRRASEDETRRKLRQLKEWYLTNHIDFVSGNGAEIRELRCTKIEFYEADMIDVYSPHNDDTIITAWIGLFRVHRILVDTGSPVSVLFSGAYSSMNLPDELIEEDENPIIGFSGEVTKAIGKVKIPITVDDKSVLGNFLLLYCRAPYNAIVGRDWLHEIGAVTSSYHQCLNFLALERVVKIRSEQMATSVMRVLWMSTRSQKLAGTKSCESSRNSNYRILSLQNHIWERSITHTM